MAAIGLRQVVLAGLVWGLAGCAVLEDRGPRSVGLPFDARLDQGETWRDFTVTVRAPGADVPDIRESARFMATRHCLERSGFSEAIWAIDPASGDWAVARDKDGNPVLSGRCAGR